MHIPLVCRLLMRQSQTEIKHYSIRSFIECIADYCLLLCGCGVAVAWMGFTVTKKQAIAGKVLDTKTRQNNVSLLSGTATYA